MNSTRNLLAGLALSALASQSAFAATYNVDELLGSVDSGSSGELVQRQGLADVLGVDLGLVTLDFKDESPAATQDDAGNWFLDVNPSEPGYFLVKFGVGAVATSHDTFFFRNLDEFTKLVFTDAQVDNITGGCGADNCNIGRLSHYTVFDVNEPRVNEVPIPAAGWLMGSALLGLMGIARKKGTIS